MTITDLEARLRLDLPRLADVIEREPTTADVVALPTRVRRRRPVVVAVVAACVAIALVLATLAIASRGREHDATPRPANRDVSVTERGWHALPPAGLGPRRHVVAVWTGTEVIVWGGARGSAVTLALQDGAAYDPRRGTWRALSRAPSAHPGARGVLAAGRVVWLAKAGGAEYDPTTDTWRELPLAPLGTTGFVAAVSSGDDVYGVTVNVLTNPASLQIARYDMRGNAWTMGDGHAVHGVTLDSVSNLSAVWTGDEIVVWDGTTRGWAYSPATDSWRDLPPLPMGDVVDVSSSVAWVDGRLFVIYSVDGAIGRLAKIGTLTGDAWAIAPAVLGRGFTTPRAVTDGHQLAVVDGEGTGPPILVELDAGGGTIVTVASPPLPPGSGTTAVWTPTGLFVWGGLPANTPSTFDNPSPNEPESAWFTP